MGTGGCAAYPWPLDAGNPYWPYQTALPDWTEYEKYMHYAGPPLWRMAPPFMCPYAPAYTWTTSTEGTGNA